MTREPLFPPTSKNDPPTLEWGAHLEQPTVAAITDAVEHTLDAAGLGGLHVLGTTWQALTRILMS